jgi:cytochrome b
MTSLLDEGSSGGESPPVEVRVWDPFVRLFHWSLASLFALAFVTPGDFQDWHETAGYAIAALVAARIVWGFAGSEHARFMSFIYAPAKILSFLRDSVLLRAKRYIGHNPAGGAMVIALLSGVSSSVVSGYMMTTDRFWGFDWVRNLHETSVYLTLALIVFHLIGVALASFEHSENLVKAMFTGRKRPDDARTQSEQPD